MTGWEAFLSYTGHPFIKFSTVEIYFIMLPTYIPELQRPESCNSFPDPAEAGDEEQGADNGWAFMRRRVEHEGG